MLQFVSLYAELEKLSSNLNLPLPPLCKTYIKLAEGEKRNEKEGKYGSDRDKWSYWNLIIMAQGKVKQMEKWSQGWQE